MEKKIKAMDGNYAAAYTAYVLYYTTLCTEWY